MGVIQCVVSYTSLGQRYLVSDGMNYSADSKTDMVLRARGGDKSYFFLYLLYTWHCTKC